MPNFIKIKTTFCGRTDGRTGGRIHGRTFETGFIRSTLSKSRPKTSAVGDPLWRQQTRVQGRCLCDPTLRVVLVQHRRVTHGQTDGHTTTAYTTLIIY